MSKTHIGQYYREHFMGTGELGSDLYQITGYIEEEDGTAMSVLLNHYILKNLSSGQNKTCSLYVMDMLYSNVTAEVIRGKIKEALGV